MDPTHREDLLKTGLNIAIVLALIAAAAIWLVPHLARTTPDSQHILVQEGVDTVIALVVSSTCGACSDDETVRAIRFALDHLVASRPRNSRTRLLGVAVGSSPSREVSFLERLGPFDEIAAGGSWGNFVFSDLVWERTNGSPAVPQLIMFVREIRVPNPTGEPFKREVLPLVVGSDRVINYLTERAGVEAP